MDTDNGRDLPEKDIQGEFDIAVIGLAGRFPGANSVEEFWQNLASERESITFFSDQQLEEAGIHRALYENTDYVKAAPVIDGPGNFDEAFFGYSPREATYTDPQQRIFLECAWQAIESAGYNVEEINWPVGVFGGSAMNTYFINTGLSEMFQNEYLPTLIGNDNSFLTTRVSYKLNLTGPSVTLQTACSSSLVAIHTACQSILSGECDMALAGGVSVRVPEGAGHLFQDGSVFSSDGHCRPFDKDASGTLFGSGVGIVVLKALDSAIEDGDVISAIIKGSAINNDGASKADYTAPSVESQSNVVTEALANSDLSAESISYIEAHGTGTNIGDPIEIAALTKAYRIHTDKNQFCAIGSVKSNIGHLDAAAGVTGLIKTVLALKNRFLPASLHYNVPNPQINFESSPFYVNSSSRNWSSDEAPLRAGVSSLGIGGTNAHVILQEPPNRPPLSRIEKFNLIPLSAKSDNALKRMLVNLGQHVADNPEININDIARTLQSGRKTFDHRYTLVANSAVDLSAQIKSIDPETLPRATKVVENPDVVFLFPGVGSQYPRMGFDLYNNNNVYRESVDECLALLPENVSSTFLSNIYCADSNTEKVAENIQNTSISMPSIFITEYAMARLWMSWGIKPAAMLGHSLGEYVAATISGNLQLSDALTLVLARGKLYETLPTGGMLSVSMSENEVSKYLSQDMSIAVVNDERSSVISGPIESIEIFQKLLDAEGVPYQKLKTTRAMHSPLTDDILEEFRTYTNEIAPSVPSIPYISNTTGHWATDQETTNSEYWVKHLRERVRFGDGLNVLLEKQNRILIEIGPGTVCSALARRNSNFQERHHAAISTMSHALKEVDSSTFALQALGKFWQSGGQVDWNRQHSQHDSRKISLPPYPFEPNNHWFKTTKNLTNLVKKASGSLDRQPALQDWFYSHSWQKSARATGVLSNRLVSANKLVVLFTDRSNLAQDLESNFRAEGFHVALIEAGESSDLTGSSANHTLSADSRKDYEKVIRILTEKNMEIQHIVHMWSSLYIDDSVSIAENFKQTQVYGYQSVLNIAKALVNCGIHNNVMLDVITSHFHNVLGDENIRPELATLSGPIRVLGQEYPNISCRGIDTDSHATGVNSNLVFQEILSEPSDLIVALRRGSRWIQSYQNLNPPQFATSRLTDSGTYLITGGLGTIGLCIAAYIANRVQAPKLILTGRSKFPEELQWDRILEDPSSDKVTCGQIRKLRNLQNRGAILGIYSADVSDLAEMKGIIRQTNSEFGKLNGVIHAAGVVDATQFAAIENTGDVETEAHFSPKIYGLINLADLLKDQTPEFCLLMSSISAVLGGIGHTAYTAANSFMDSFAMVQNSSAKFQWDSINWDIWRIGDSSNGNDSPDAASLANLGISNHDAEVLLDRIFSMTGVSPLVVSSGDLHARIDQWLNQSSAVRTNDKASSSSSADDLPNSHQSSTIDTDFRRKVTAVWSTHLGIENIDIHANFTDLGGHSLLAAQITADLRNEFDVALSIKDLFNLPTVALLADEIENRKKESAISEEQNLAELMSSIESMSDQEVRRLLDED